MVCCDVSRRRRRCQLQHSRTLRCITCCLSQYFCAKLRTRSTRVPLITKPIRTGLRLGNSTRNQTGLKLGGSCPCQFTVGKHKNRGVKHIRSTNLQQGEPQPVDAHRTLALNTALGGYEVSVQTEIPPPPKKIKKLINNNNNIFPDFIQWYPSA